MAMKKFHFAILIAFLIAGCAGNANKEGVKTAAADEYKPKPVSSVFRRPDGFTKINFDSNGKFLSMNATASAPIAANNAASVEQAVSVATMRAKRSLAEFMGNQLSTTRSLKIISHTVQRSLENTANGTDTDLVVDDKDFSADGSLKSGATPSDNQNSQKIAETVIETIKSNSTQMLRGVAVISEKVDAEGRTVQVEVKADVNSIAAAKDLRKLME